MYLLSTVLLLAGITVMHRLKQPARRIVVARSIAAGLASLGIIATAQGWPRIAAFEWRANAAALASPVHAPTHRFDTPPAKSVEQVELNVAIGQPLESDIAPPAARGDARAQTPLSFGDLASWLSLLTVTFTTGVVINLAWLTLGAIQAVFLRTRHDGNAPDCVACGTHIAGASLFTARRPEQSHRRSGCAGDGPADDHLA